MISVGKKTYRTWAEPAASLAIFALSLPLLYLLSRIDFDPHHTSLMLKTAVDVANGKILFAETFTQYGALTAWIQALFVKLMGTSVTSILFATCLFYSLSYVLLYRVARRFLDLPLSLLTVAITVLLAPFYMWEFNPWSSVFALFFLLLSLLMLFGALESDIAWKKAVFAPVSGLFVSLTFWCRQPAGLVAALAGILFFAIAALILRKEKALCRRFLTHLVLFLLGVAVGFILLLIPILATGAWSDFVAQSIKGMLTFASDRATASGGGAWSALWKLISHLFLKPLQKTDELPVLNGIWILLPLCVVGLAILTFCRLCRRAKREEWAGAQRQLPTLAYVLMAGCAWHQYYPVPCYRHWYWGAFLCVPAALILVHELLSFLATRPKCQWLCHEKHRTLAFLAALALLFLPNVGARAAYGIGKIADTAHTVKIENAHYDYLNGLYLDEEMALYYNDLFDTVHALRARFPEKNVINLTQNGIYAMFGENFHTMFIYTEDFYYADYPAVQRDYVAANRPIVIAPLSPGEDYVLYHTFKGDHGDPTAEYHHMPAYIYLPVELYEQVK